MLDKKGKGENGSVWVKFQFLIPEYAYRAGM